MNKKYDYKVRYRIFEVSTDGLLKCPKESTYGCMESVFPNDFESIEEAMRMINKVQIYTEFLILPVAVVSYLSDSI